MKAFRTMLQREQLTTLKQKKFLNVESHVTYLMKLPIFVLKIFSNTVSMFI